MNRGYEVVDRRRRDRQRLRRLLEDPETAARYTSTLYMTPETCEAALEDRRGIAPSPEQIDLAEVVETARPGDTGLCLFEGPEGALAVLPPFPITSDDEARGFEPGPLLDLVARDRTVLVVLVRLGRYSVGLLHGDEVVASKSGTRHVKNRHRAGGSSQRRFMRSRERLMREFFDATCGFARAMLEANPEAARAVEYVIYGGEAGTVRGLRERCDLIERLEAPALARLLPIDRPGHKPMQGIGAEVYASATLTLRRV